MSLFYEILAAYGFRWAGVAFSFVVLTAALSCSCSGLYACSRALHRLAQMKIVPAFFGNLNHTHIPRNAIIFSVCVVWLSLFLNAFQSVAEIYVFLLALSGFSEAITWISICLSQLRFRKQKIRENTVADLSFKIPLFPMLTLLMIAAQIACLVFMAFDAELRVSFWIGIPLLVLPMLLYRWKQKKA